METKGIDLTKCNNCRAWVRYRNDRVYEDTGRIEKVTEEGGEVWMRFVADEDGELIIMWENGKICEHIMDFEIVPRDPETYKDWQVGDIVARNDKTERTKEVIFRSGELVVCKNADGDIDGGYTCGQLHRLGFRLVLTDIERQIIEARKKAEWKPQDGDICYVENRSEYHSVFISAPGYETSYYVSYGGCGCERNLSIKKPAVTYSVMGERDIKILRPATEEEKQRLFDAMAKRGKRWNAEKKVVEDIPKPHEFKKGEPVLARDNGGFWKVGVFTEIRSGYNKYIMTTDGVDDCGYRECIPYNERTMHLLGTTDDYKEE